MFFAFLMLESNLGWNKLVVATFHYSYYQSVNASGKLPILVVGRGC